MHKYRLIPGLKKEDCSIAPGLAFSLTCYALLDYTAAQVSIDQPSTAK